MSCFAVVTEKDDVFEGSCPVCLTKQKNTKKSSDFDLIFFSFFLYYNWRNIDVYGT